MDKIGKYAIQDEIGRGGMGVVYRAIDPYIGRTVAIKTVRLDLLRQEAGKDEALKRFLREAQAVGNLSHPNIVTIYDVGEAEGLVYIAMEYIAGDSLETLLQQGRKFSLTEIVRLFSQVTSALDYAHGRGIVHRDIKPANILVGADLKASLVDFGIARTSASTMTQTGMLMGTPRYMSPEQIAGKKVDHRADLFSLGAILYELLTQHNPFEGDSITTVIYKIMHTELPPLSEFDRQLPAALDPVLRQALARDADQRYASGAELLAGLQAAAAAPVPPAGGAVDPRAALERTEVLDSGEKTVFQYPAAGRKRPLPVLAALLAVLAAIVAAVYFFRTRPPAPAAEAVAAVANATVEPGMPSEGVPGPAALPADAATAPAGQDSAPPASNGAPMGGGSKPAPAATAAPPQRQAPPLVAAVANSRGYLEASHFNDTVMIQVPAGEFTIGSPSGQGDKDEHPAHRVYIGAFWLARTEVTFAQYDAFCQATNRPLPSDEGWGRGSRPVINVSWEDAGAYCRWLAQQTGLPFRLPSEAEWEKAAREHYPWGSTPPGTGSANMKGPLDGYAFTAPVASFPAGASPYGHLDLAGNVWEWTADWYDADYYRRSPGRDPRGPASGTERSVRGGSWANGPDLIRSANRSSERPDRSLNLLGFRVAMDDR